MIDRLMENPVVGFAALGASLAVGLLVLLVALRPPSIPIERRRPGLPPRAGLLERGSTAATGLIARLLRRRNRSSDSAFQLAAVKMRPQDIVFLVIVASLVGFAMGLLIRGVPLAILLACLPPVGFRIWLGMRIGSRQKAFAEQLDDSLVLMASNLRAGHSLAQALASVASEADSPTAEEFARVVNETRVGRPLVESLDDAAARMESEDFSWVAQAIGINHDVGGNLAEVLDRVANTIRQRNEVRRLVSTLSAEGRLSAVILIALPFVVTGFLLMTNPGYLAPLVSGPIGIAMLVVGAIMLVVGSFWLHKTVTIKF